MYHSSDRYQAGELLKKLDKVEKVLTVPVPVNAIAPDFRANQVYCRDAASGINSDSLISHYHIKGGGIRVCDIEYNFLSTHADLPTITAVNGPVYDPFNDTHHATAVMGVIAAKDNNTGTTGIAPDYQLYFSHACLLPDSSYDLARAVTDALPYLSPGDIILFEQQIPGPNYDSIDVASQRGLVPVEWFEPYYDVIQLASGLGITVVEAAGNGQENLDAPEYATGNDGHHPFLPGNRSQAIIAGAGAVGLNLNGTDNARSRMWFSNYGSRVDVQGNGECIYTPGYGDIYNLEGINHFYTNQFGGTSGASPMIVGAVALIQSVHKQLKGSPVATTDILQALKSTGKAQTNGMNAAATHPIGPLPDVYKAVKSVLSASSVVTLAKAPGSWSVFPNPTNGKCTIQVQRKLKDQCIIEVIDALGRKIQTTTLDPFNNSAAIDLALFPDGLYLVNIRSGSWQESGRLILKH